jgi:hypothetical protein
MAVIPVYCIWGESNADSQASYGTLPAGEDAGDDRCHILNNTTNGAFTAGVVENMVIGGNNALGHPGYEDRTSVCGMEIGILDHVINGELNPIHPFCVIIKMGAGGSTTGNWKNNEGGTDPFSPNGYLTMATDRIDIVRAYIVGLGHTPLFNMIGTIGLNNDQQGIPWATYRSELSWLIDYFRTYFGDETCKFFLTLFQNKSAYDNLNNSITTVAASKTNVITVETPLITGVSSGPYHWLVGQFRAITDIIFPQLDGYKALTLLDSLEFFYKSDEASGNLVDVHNGHTATQTGSGTSVTSGTGLVYSTARLYGGAGAKYFTLADDNDVLHLGPGVSWSAGVWIKRTGPIGNNDKDLFIAKGNGGVESDTNFEFYCRDWGGWIQFLQGTAGTANTGLTDTTHFAADQWFWISWGHDAANELDYLQINDQIQTGSNNGVFNETLDDWLIGKDIPGLMGPVMFARRCWSSAERLSLYNSGAGRTYTSLSDITAVTSPASADVLIVGDAHAVTFTTAGTIAAVDVLLSLDGGSTYTITLTSSLTNTGSYTYTPDQAHVTATAKIKVRSSADALVFAESDSFVIATTTAGAALFTGVIA